MAMEVEIMSLGSMQLRLESRNGSPATEYRTDRGNVEVRTLDCESDHVRVWSRLTTWKQLSIHVKRNTVVSRWLERRLGWSVYYGHVWARNGRHSTIRMPRSLP